MYKEDITSKHKIIISIVFAIFIIFSFFASYLSFEDYDYLKGSLWMISSLLFFLSLCIFLQFIKVKKTNVHSIVSITAFLFSMVSMLLPSYLLDDLFYHEKIVTYNWMEINLNEKLPQPVSNRAVIYNNSYDLLDMYIYDIYPFRFEDYIFECEAMGYTKDIDQNEYSFDAYNEEGYELNLWYNEEQEKMEITLYAPIEMDAYVWPENKMVSTLPLPTSSIGKIEWESVDSFSIYIGDTSLTDFNMYINECMKAGYNVDYSRYEDSFYANHKEGYRLSLHYKKNQTMYISLYK